MTMKSTLYVSLSERYRLKIQYSLAHQELVYEHCLETYKQFTNKNSFHLITIDYKNIFLSRIELQ